MQTIRQRQGLRKWEAMTPGFKSDLNVHILPGGRKGVLLEPLRYVSVAGEVIVVPAGFQTDFASVPRIFWAMFPPWGRYSPAAVVHDYLYVVGGCPRIHADRMFLEAMEILGVSWFNRHIMYRAVRLGGGVPWGKNREQGL